MKVIYETDRNYVVFYFSMVDKKYKKQKQLKISDLAKILEAQEPIKGILLDEGKFRYYSFTIFGNYKKLNITKLKAIIEGKINEIRNLFGEKRKLLYTSIDNIIVNGVRDKYILGKSGDVYFDLRFFYIDEDVYDFFYVYRKRCLEEANLWPRSFFTIKFINEILEKRDYNLLYFFDKDLVKIVVKGGFYNKIDKINLGYDYLRQLFEERGVKSLYYQLKTKQVCINQFSERILKDILKTYFKFIFEWFFSGDEANHLDIILIGTQRIKNKIFFDLLTKTFKNNHILPFNHSSKLARKFVGSNIPIDVQCFLYFRG